MKRRELESCACWLASPPPSGRGAIAIIELRGDVDGGLERAGIGRLRVGDVKLRSLAGIDDGLVARWSDASATIMPHGGPAVVAAVLEHLSRAGLVAGGDVPAREAWSEARSEIEARMLDALARAASPLAVDLLLDQARRWDGADPSGFDEDDARRWRRLNRLIEPPLVVALGPPNIGKSTLLNTLAGRSVSLVADESGTTRDHVGVLLDLGGLVVRYLDTPGIGHAGTDCGVEAQAESEALRLAKGADLVVLCHDSASVPPAAPPDVEVIAVQLRSDLGHSGAAGAVVVCAPRGTGIAELVTAIRERLTPASDLANPRPWRFWAERL